MTCLAEITLKEINGFENSKELFIIEKERVVASNYSLLFIRRDDGYNNLENTFTTQEEAEAKLAEMKGK